MCIDAEFMFKDGDANGFNDKCIEAYGRILL